MVVPITYPLKGNSAQWLTIKILELLVSDKTFLDNKNLGLVPFAGISPFWLFLFYHKLL